jgi:hypothetical protein
MLEAIIIRPGAFPETVNKVVILEGDYYTKEGLIMKNNIESGHGNKHQIKRPIPPDNSILHEMIMTWLISDGYVEKCFFMKKNE